MQGEQKQDQDQLERLNQYLNSYCSELETHCDNLESVIRKLRTENQQMRAMLTTALGDKPCATATQK